MRRVLCAIILIILVGAGVFSEARAARAVAFFESLKHTKGKFAGHNFELLAWQRQIVRDVYGTVNERGLRLIRTVYLEVPKKNGKSEMVAGAALYHTFADAERNGEVYGCAADKEQASIVFDVAVDMIDQVPALKKRAKLNLSTKKITDRVSGSFYKVVSSEAYSKHGLNISAVVFDELHAQPNRELWDVMTFGAGDAREQPIWWIITTAGDDPDRVSICWEQHEYAQKILSGDVVDPTWYPVIFGYEGDDIYNEEHWKRANPSLGQTITLETVQAAAAKAREKPAEERLFRWLRLNQWITTKLTTWLPLELFDQTVGEWARVDLLGRDCYLGLDLSSTTDLTAVALIFPPQPGQVDWRVIWECWIPRESMRERVERDRVPYNVWESQGWLNVTEGDVVDYTAVEEKINELGKLYKIKEVDADRAFATMLLQRLEKAGLTVATVPQTFMGLTAPMNETERLMREKKLTHERNPVARWAFGNTSIAKNGSGLIKYVKEYKGKSPTRTKRIDLLAAWITGMARAMTYKSKGSIYDGRGLRSV